MITILSCKKVSRLVSESQERPLSWHERLAMYFHLCICHSCREFRKQIKFMQNIFKDGEGKELLSVEDESLSNEANKRIREILSNYED